MRRTAFVATILAVVVGATFAQESRNSAEERAFGAVDFERDIRPIFDRHCAACHNPNKKRGGLDLSNRSAAVAGGSSGPAVMPKKPEESLIISRLRSTDPDERMPLAAEPLPDAVISLFERWIGEGAKWPRSAVESKKEVHWAYRPPVRAKVPETKFDAWARTPIDRFIAAKLEDAGLSPSPEADRTTLLRRLSFDLVGLPPTTEEIEAFRRDESKDAYEKVVDRLLASPHYGEHAARRWLDLARYADTNGYEKDLPRTLWPWRDWVIAAKNADMPYDEFSVKQLAGDLLPGATAADRIATGFHRNTMLNDEGGVDAEEFRVAAIVDRVATTATVWLGQTLACAQCHDHKYDPLTQRDYYSFFAFFNQTEDTGVGFSPEIDAPTPEEASERRLLESRAQEATARSDALYEKYRRIDALIRLRFAEEDVPKKPLFAIDAKGVGIDDFELRRESDTLARPTFVEASPLGQALILDGDSRFVQKQATIAERPLPSSDRPFYFGAWISRRPGASGAVIAAIDNAASYRGYDLFLNGGKLEVHIAAKWPDDALKVETESDVVGDGWTHVAAIWDGSGKGVGVRIFVDGAEVPVKAVNDHLTSIVKPATPLAIGSRASEGFFKGKIVAPFFAEGPARPGDIVRIALEAFATILDRPENLRTADDHALLRRAAAMLVPEIADAKRAEQSATAALAAHRVTRSMVLAERSAPRENRILLRGDFRTPGGEVLPSVPEVLPPLPKFLPRNRLLLAAWLFSPENPLTARVAANRVWAALLGRGIVPTVDDFGVQGDPPSHPELLDCLAVEFRESGYREKALVRSIVTSAFYRQTSVTTPEMIAKDPENRLFARAPRYRLSAEEIRDQALSLAGLLSAKIGGPSVMPPQPPGTWGDSFAAFDTPNEKWIDARGPSRFRRGIYTYWRRSAAYPAALVFDAARRESCTVERARTNTPLQALITLNDTVYVEAAIGFARRMIKDGGSDDAARIAFGFSLATGRAPRDDDQKTLAALLARSRAIFASDRGAAEKLVTRDDVDLSGLDKIEVAAWMSVANVLLNLDETLTKG